MDKNNSLLRDRSHHHNNNNNHNNKTTTKNNNNNNTTTNTTSSSSDFVLQWGNRKRLRCMKLQQQQQAAAAAAKDKEAPAATPPAIGQRSITPRVDHHRRVVKSPNHHQQTKDSVAGYINLRQRSASPAPHRVLRNSENTIGGGMKGQSNGGARRVCSPDRTVQDKRSGSHNNKNIIVINNNNNGGGSGSSETAHDAKKGGTSPGNEGIPVVWPPKFAIGLTNKEKEEDFLAIKGSKLPQRPKKRAKLIQRTINLVTPGGWLCDLTLERYEVREKKITKKRPRGIKAMGSMESESE